jgi:ribose transport system substrate-binding protein
MMDLGRSTRFVRNLAAAAIAGAFACAAGIAHAEDFDDGLSANYAKALKGKTVAFVPISLSFDIPQAYNVGMKRQAEKLGYKYVVRDPNFSVEQAAQAIEQLIAEKPDLIVVQPLDAQAFNRLVKKANAAGILWMWANVKSAVNGDAYVGGNHYLEARLQMKLAADRCGAGTSGKIALIQSPPNTQSTITGTQGITDEMKLHPGLTLVATQSADADANKAKTIASTILKQNPDLCAFIGLWDGEDIGIPPAVEEAGMKGKVAVITTGAGNQPNACDKIADGSYTDYVSYDVAAQVQDINAAIVMLLQTKPKPGSDPFAIYNHPKVLTKATLTPTSCWKMDDIDKPMN